MMPTLPERVNVPVASRPHDLQIFLTVHRKETAGLVADLWSGEERRWAEGRGGRKSTTISWGPNEKWLRLRL